MSGGLGSLEGRIAVVTGGASGIGRGIAGRLIGRGAMVVIADIEEPALRASAQELGAEAVIADVSERRSMRELAECVLDRHGQVDILVNNAGVGPLKPFDELSTEDFEWVLGVNLWGVIHGTQAFLPALRMNPNGAWIVNTASVAGLVTVPGMAAYSASKFAVVGFSEVLAQELDQTSVGVSILVPALVRSNIATGDRNRPGVDRSKLDASANDAHLPPGRMLEPEDVGALVADAITDGRRYIVTHPETLPAVARRHRAIEQAFHVDEEKG